jgi:hypothetical protein
MKQSAPDSQSGSKFKMKQPLSLITTLLALLFLGLPPAPAATSESEVALNTWLVLGLYENTRANDGMETDWIKESSVVPAQGLKHGEKVWNYFDDRLFSRNYDDYQDLYSYFKLKLKQPVAARIAYAHTYLYTEKSRKAVLKLGADSEMKLFLNGNPCEIREKSKSIRVGKESVLALEPGWNRLLVKVGNRGEGRLGFYARLAGEGVNDVVVSSEGQGKGELAVASQDMGDVAKNTLPVAWREWPYVAANAWEYLDKKSQTYQVCSEFIEVDLVPQAGSFQLQAQGGKPPYRWQLSQGHLPQGLSLRESGVIEGTISSGVELKDYSFKVKLKDASSKEVEKAFTLIVKERPNRFYEQARLVGLVHAPQTMPEKSHAEFVRSMKRMGYQVIMPITSYNGDPRYTTYWRHPSKDAVSDYITPFKQEADRQGMAFGTYIGNMKIMPGYGGTNSVNGFVLEILEKFHPRVIWFDHAGLNEDALDALYSMIKSFDPETIIMKNGVPTLATGDWDSLCLESIGFLGKGIWNSIPINIPWFKKFPLETWRHYADARWSITPKAKPEDNNPVEYLKLIVSIIGTGNVADFDHSPTYQPSLLDETDKPIPMASLSEAPFWKCQEEMANWASPEKIPSLTESYTKVDPAPLPAIESGYLLTNGSRDVLYVHLIKNPWGKKGFPTDKKLSLNLPGIKVTQVRWMNQDKEVPFQQDKDLVQMNLSGVSEDPVSTILKLKLDKALPSLSSDTVKESRDISSILAASGVAKGNLAFNKPSLLLDGASQERRGPSSNRFSFQGNDGLSTTSTAAGYSWAWIYELDLESSHTLGKVVVTFDEESYPTDYKIFVSSDQKSWKEVAQANPTKGGRYEHVLTVSDVRYIRVQSLKPDGPNQPGGQMSIAELEVYGAD